MYTNHHNVIQAEAITPRRHKITLLVTTSPDDVTRKLEHYRAAAEHFAYTHNAKVVGDIDVSLNPFRESAVIFFEVKAWKHPEKHRFEFNFTGDTHQVQ